MIFSSNIFVYAFLPVVIIVYYLFRMIPKVYRPLTNLVLLGASIMFYAWGGGRYSIILWSVVLVDYIMGLLVSYVKKGRKVIYI